MWSIDVLVIGIWSAADEKYSETNFFFVIEKRNYINNMSYKIKLFTRRFECHCIVEMQQKGFKKKYIWIYSLKIDKNTQILFKKMGSTYHSLYRSNDINLAKKYTTVIKWSVHYHNYLPRFHVNKNVEQRKRNTCFKIDSGYFLVFVQLYDLYNRYLFCLHKHIWNKRIAKKSRQMAIIELSHTVSAWIPINIDYT